MSNVAFGVQFNGVAMGSVIGPLASAENAEAWGYQSYFVPDSEVSVALDPMVLLTAAAQTDETVMAGNERAGPAIPPPLPVGQDGAVDQRAI